MLLRVPGLGARAVDRILARPQAPHAALDDLGRLTAGLRRARPFLIAADHRPTRLADRPDLRRRLAEPPRAAEPVLMSASRRAPISSASRRAVRRLPRRAPGGWSSDEASCSRAATPGFAAKSGTAPDLFGARGAAGRKTAPRRRCRAAPPSSSDRGLPPRPGALRPPLRAGLARPARRARAARGRQRPARPPARRMAQSDPARPPQDARLPALPAGRGARSERYVAWFEPEHFILAAAAPFFVDRFRSLRLVDPDARSARPIGTVRAHLRARPARARGRAGGRRASRRAGAAITRASSTRRASTRG